MEQRIAECIHARRQSPPHHLGSGLSLFAHGMALGVSVRFGTVSPAMLAAFEPIEVTLTGIAGRLTHDELERWLETRPTTAVIP
jgi:hypothetical protein